MRSTSKSVLPRTALCAAVLSLLVCTAPTYSAQSAIRSKVAAAKAAPAKLAVSRTSKTPIRIPVPLVRQATDYTCGVTALESVLAYYGEESREDKLAQLCKSTPQDGTSYRQMKSYAESHGYTVEVKTGLSLAALKRLIDQGRPPICLIQAWPEHPVDFAKDWQDGHYVVAVGYDNDRIYFMDPSTIGNYTYIANSEFLDRWHDRDSVETLQHFAMVIGKSRPAYNPAEFKPLQ